MNVSRRNRKAWKRQPLKPNNKPKKAKKPPEERTEEERRICGELIGSQSFDRVVEALGCSDWDVIIVGDGSGSGWQHACGWGATLICRTHKIRKFFYGGADCGSVNFAETMPYVQAVTWYDTHYGCDLLKQKGILNVYILTDSQSVVKWGTAAMQSVHMSDLPRKQLGLFALFREYRTLGYMCHFRWAPRMQSDMNWAADLIASVSRRAVISAKDAENISGEGIAQRAANILDNLVFQNPYNGETLNPNKINPETTD